MIKKLDILILKAFFWPFVATFFITLFVFMMQILWKYIDDLVGKGLDFWTLSEFLIYASATLVTLAMPISILLSSIMTFGKLGENFELVAIKSSGISLLRFMRPLFFMSVIFSGVAFLFANNIAPVANLKFAVIYHDIYQKSPAFDLRPGIFYKGFEGFSIKVGEKKQDSLLKDIIIYERTNTPQDNTIISERGKMVTGGNKQFLEFYMENGHRYEETFNYEADKTEFVNLGFKEYTKLFDLSQLNLESTSDSLFMNNIRMKSMRQLTEDLDSLKKQPEIAAGETKRSMAPYMKYFLFSDSVTQVKDSQPPLVQSTSKLDTAGFASLIPDTLKGLVFNRSLIAIGDLRNITQLAAAGYDNRTSDIIQHKIEWQKKLSLSVACIVLFFIGAPLGSIIRKGGLGLPLVMALIFFMIFYLLNIFGEKFAKDGIVSPVLGLWLPVIVLTPVGFFLTYKAMHDSQLFNREFYYRVGRKVKALIRK